MRCLWAPLQTNPSDSLRCSPWKLPHGRGGGGGFPMAYARPLQEVITQGMTLFLETFSSLQLCSQRGERPSCPPGLRPGQFCAHGETVGKSSLPQVQSQPCPFPDSQGAEILVLPSALRPHPGLPGAPSLGGAGAPRVTFSFSDLCLPSSPPPPPPSPGNC